MRPGGHASSDRRIQLSRRADVQKARIIRPSGIPGVYWVMVNGAKSETMARGSSSYKAGALVPVGSEQGETLRTILIGGIAGQSGHGAFPVERPIPRAFAGEQSVLDYCDPDAVAPGATVLVSFIGKRFRPGMTVAAVVWGESPVPGWYADDRLAFGAVSFIDSTRLDCYVTVAPLDLPEGVTIPLTVCVR